MADLWWLFLLGFLAQTLTAMHYRRAAGNAYVINGLIAEELDKQYTVIDEIMDILTEQDQA